MTATRTRPPTGRARPSREPRRIPVLGIVAGLVVLLAAVAVVVTLAGDDDGGTPGIEQTRPVSIEGPALPPLDDPANDAAVGLTPPLVTGASFDGQGMSVGNPSQLVMFVAHWCPHCQREVPIITDWLAAGGTPEDVDLVAVSTAVTPSAPNYSPSDWLEREGWPVPTLADDAESGAGTAFGVSAYPGFVAIGPDGTVTARASGELTVAALEALVSAARGEG